MGYSQGSQYTMRYASYLEGLGTLNQKFKGAVMFCGYLPTNHLGIMGRINEVGTINLPAFVF